MIRTLCFAASVALGIVNLPQPGRGPSAFDDQAIVIVPPVEILPIIGETSIDRFYEEFRDI